MAAGTGGLVVLNNFNTQLGFRSDNVGRVNQHLHQHQWQSDHRGRQCHRSHRGPCRSPATASRQARHRLHLHLHDGLVNAAGAANATVTQAATTNNAFTANVGAPVNLNATAVTGNGTNSTVTVPSTAGLLPGMALYGARRERLTITQITSATTFTVSGPPVTLSGVGQIAAVLGTSAFNTGLMIAEGNHIATLSTDRIGTTATGQTFVMNGGITFGGSPGEQGQTLNCINANSMTNLVVSGGLNLGPGWQRLHQHLERCRHHPEHRRTGDRCRYPDQNRWCRPSTSTTSTPAC